MFIMEMSSLGCDLLVYVHTGNIPNIILSNHIRTKKGIPQRLKRGIQVMFLNLYAINVS